MITASELIAQAQKAATAVTLARKLVSDLARNVQLAAQVLTASDLDAIKAAYSETDMLETSAALDDAINQAREAGR